MLGYHHGIMKTLEYPLGASLLTEAQCEHIQSPALTTALQKSGIVSTISHDIIHDRPNTVGLTFPIFTQSQAPKRFASY